MQAGSYLLSLAVWVPIVAGVLVLATGKDSNAGIARPLALLGALIGFLVTLPLLASFNAATSAMQFVEKSSWIERFGINYHLGVDGTSVLFILLNSFVTVLVVLAGWKVIERRVAQYMAAFLIMSGLMNGTFAALDAIGRLVTAMKYSSPSHPGSQSRRRVFERQRPRP